MALFARPSRGGRKPRRFLPAVEALEGRYVPSASAPFPVHHAHHQPRVSKDLGSLLGSIFGGSQVQGAVNKLTQNNSPAQSAHSQLTALELQEFMTFQQFTVQQLLQQQQEAVQQLLQEQQILLPLQLQQQSSPQAQQQLIQQQQDALRQLEFRQQEALAQLGQQQQAALVQFVLQLLSTSHTVPPAGSPSGAASTPTHHAHHLGHSSGTTGMVP